MTRPNPSIAEQVASVPDAPGVYLWKSAEGSVLYVGKAKSLRKRMRQYTSGQDEREKIPLMMEQVTSFDYVVTTTEVESLVLEKNLIKQFRPPYNVDYRDDKTLPVHRADARGPVPGHQVHPREAPRRHPLLRAVHRCARRARDDRHRAPHRPDLPSHLQRVEARHRPRWRRVADVRASTTTSGSAPGRASSACTHRGVRRERSHESRASSRVSTTTSRSSWSAGCARRG